MYCCHCGKEIDERKAEQEHLSQAMHEGEIDENTKVSYVCPRCGHLIHQDVDEKEIKTLAAASHAEIQIGRNNISNGMSFLCVGVIVLILAVIFFVLAKKPANNFVLVTTCPEFFVSMACFLAGGIMVILGAIFTTKGIILRQKYEALLKDINNDVFHQ